MTSLSFDRAASYYDRTRSLSDEAQDAVTSILADELQGRGAVLEVGIGTGRIALPLVARGIDVWGVDLSLEMLRVLTTKPRAASVPLSVADATSLPFRPGAVGAVLACHVLHLIPPWRRAVAEMVRVTAPGGTVLVDLGGWGSGDWEAIQMRFVAEAGVVNPRPGVTEAGVLDDEMASLGASLRLLPEVEDVRRTTFGELVDRIENGIYSFTWSTDEATRRRVAASLRGWIASELGPLDQPREHLWTVRWRAYDLGT